VKGKTPTLARHQGFWIFSPIQDVTFVLFTPIAILLTFAAARRGGWTDGLVSFGLAMAMAHYLPGMLRAYGDRALFRRFRVRLIVAPLFLVMISTVFAYLNLHIIILLATLWAAWHWMMQIYGFVRIYDAKALPAARTPAILERTLCFMWFGMCAFVINNTLPTYVTGFYESGGPRLPAEVFTRLSQVWLAATLIVTLIYLSHTVTRVIKGQRPNPLKFVLFIGSFAYLAYTVSIIEQPVMAMVMFEAWHDIQYLAIVWVFNVNRTQKGNDTGNFIRFLFRPRAVLVIAYVGLCLAFGSLTHAWRLFENETLIRVAVSLVAATAMFHYYLDGFIWKIREKETRQALGVQGTEEQRSVGAGRLMPAWAGHAILWMLFVVPTALFFGLESRDGHRAPLAIYQDLVQSFPDSPRLNDELGKQLVAEGRTREARRYFERAVALAPGMFQTRVTLGALLNEEGDFGGARTQFEYALKIDPRNAQVHDQLGMLLGEQGDLQGAKKELELAVGINPGYALAHNNLGIVYRESGDLAQARVHSERAVSIDPHTAEFQYQLGETLSRQGDLNGAAEHLTQVLRLDPNHYLAHNSLGIVLRNQGKLTEATEHFEQALSINPRDDSAQENLAAALQDLRRSSGR
jgi:tetratricopeptide (TPR) repeat protein